MKKELLLRHWRKVSVMSRSIRRTDLKLVFVAVLWIVKIAAEISLSVSLVDMRTKQIGLPQ